jgi:glycosyltransferase involved in cell wall biosynthesis
MHVMANSGLVWYLVVSPAIHVARLRRVPVVVNYRGGLAAEFLAKRSRSVLATLRHAQRVVVPSEFLRLIFRRYGVEAHIVPNIVDTQVFRPVGDAETRLDEGPHIIVTRNLEAIYGIDTAIRAVSLLRKAFPEIRLSIAGEGVERVRLERLAAELGSERFVAFTGRLETAEMVRLYRQADVLLNPSRVDNMPNSILEALASGVPVVSTDVGGVPHLVEHGRSAWLVPADDPHKMAQGIERVLRDAPLRAALRAAGLQVARACSWPEVKPQWLATYQAVSGQ